VASTVRNAVTPFGKVRQGKRLFLQSWKFLQGHYVSYSGRILWLSTISTPVTKPIITKLKLPGRYIETPTPNFMKVWLMVQPTLLRNRYTVQRADGRMRSPHKAGYLHRKWRFTNNAIRRSESDEKWGNATAERQMV